MLQLRTHCATGAPLCVARLFGRCFPSDFAVETIWMPCDSQLRPHTRGCDETLKILGIYPRSPAMGEPTRARKMISDHHLVD